MTATADEAFFFKEFLLFDPLGLQDIYTLARDLFRNRKSLAADTGSGSARDGRRDWSSRKQAKQKYNKCHDIRKYATPP